MRVLVFVWFYISGHFTKLISYRHSSRLSAVIQFIKVFFLCGQGGFIWFHNDINEAMCGDLLYQASLN